MSKLIFSFLNHLCFYFFSATLTRPMNPVKQWRGRFSSALSDSTTTTTVKGSNRWHVWRHFWLQHTKWCTLYRGWNVERTVSKKKKLWEKCHERSRRTCEWRSKRTQTNENQQVCGAASVQQGAASHLWSPPCLDGRWGWRRRAGAGAHRCPGGRGSCVSATPGCPCDNGGDGYRGNGWGEH